MLKIILNLEASDDRRRQTVQDGAILLYSGSPESIALANLARDMVSEAFDGRDPEHAQEDLAVEDFVQIVGPMKSRFTNAPETKERLRAYLLAMGVDPTVTYFDVPRLRVVPHSDYLSAGVSYAYKAHRDIWYSSPTAQLNWWLPVWDVTTDKSMVFYPTYWDTPIPNTSEDFDYGEWVRIGRAAAASQIKEDTRKHPLPLKALTPAEEFRYGAKAGDLVLFSASQLHATAPNTSDATRYSLDFRTVNIEDLRKGRGGPNIDCRSRGSTLGDFLRVDDLSPIELTADLEVA